MDGVARFDARRRAGLFDEAGARRGVSSIIIEKDFWVCWALKHLFGHADAGAFIFKGGTSLSKAFGVIRRFSERQLPPIVDPERVTHPIGHGRQKFVVKVRLKLLAQAFEQLLRLGAGRRCAWITVASVAEHLAINGDVNVLASLRPRDDG